MEINKINEFKSELRALLIKYDVGISAECDETQGVTGETMCISMNKGPWTTIIKIDGWEIEPDDLK